MVKSGILDIPLFEEYLKENTTLAESSIRAYVDAVLFFVRSDHDILDIKAYNDFLINNSIKKRNYLYYYAIKEWLKYKFDAKVRGEIISQLIKPKMNNDIVMIRKNLIDDEVIEVINNLQSRKHRMIAILQNLTGARAGDILSLKKTDIHIDELNDEPVIRLNIKGKGNKRVVKSLFDGIAQKLLLEYVSSTNNMEKDYCFVNKYTRQIKSFISDYRLIRLNYVWYWRDLKMALEISGINRKDFATHDFRRQFARKVWDKYKDIVILQNILDHNRPDTTIRYLKQSGLQNQDVYKEMQN
jgi:integrase